MTRDRRALAPPLPDADRLLAEADWLRSLAQQLVGRRGPEAVDELVQETLVARLDRRGPAPGRERAWLRRVAVNLVRQSFRRRAARARRERASALPEAVASAGDVVARAQTHRLLVDAVLGLDEPFRTTLLRRFFDRLEPAAIARLDGVPAATVRTRIHRGLARLRATLTARHGGRSEDWLAGAAALVPPGSAPAKFVFGSVGVLLMQKFIVAALAGLALVGGVAWFLGGGAAGVAGSTAAADRAATDRGGALAAPRRAAVPGPAARGSDAPRTRLPDAVPSEPRAAGAAIGVTIGVRVTGDGRARATTAVAFQRAEYPAPVDGRYRRQEQDRAAKLVDARATLAALGVGDWWVAVLDGERVLSQKSVLLRADDAVHEVVFPLGLASIAGCVRDATGRPQAGQLVRCSLLDDGAYRSDTRTDARGHYRFESVPLGTAWLGVYADADFSQPPRSMREFAIADAKTYRVDFGTAAPASVWRGTVRNRLGQVVPGQLVDFRPGRLLLRSAAGERRIVPLRPDGTFEAALSPGSWTVRVQAPSQVGGGTELPQPVAIGRTDLERDLALPWRRVQGRLIDAATGIAMPGEALADARVELWRVPRNDGSGPNAAAPSRLLGVHRIDPVSGTFCFDAVEPGSGYELRCGAIGAKRPFALPRDRGRLEVDLTGRRPR